MADSGAAAAGIATGTTGAVIYVGIVWWAIRRARRTYSKWIVKRLKRTGSAVILDVKDRRGTWNPAKKEVSGRLFATGQAEYTLDASGVVHLRFHSKSGGEQHYEGPIPEWHGSPAGRRRQQFMRIFYAVYLAVLTVGFGLGYLLSAGSVTKRLVIGFVGLLGAILVIAVSSTFVRVGFSVRTVIRDRNGQSRMKFQ